MAAYGEFSRHLENCRSPIPAFAPKAVVAMPERRVQLGHGITQHGQDEFRQFCDDCHISIFQKVFRHMWRSQESV